MDKSLTQSIQTHSVRLGIFALLTASLLGLVNIGTLDRIAAQQEKSQQEAFNQILPPSQYDNDLLNDKLTLDPQSSTFTDINLLGLSETRFAYIAKQQGQPSGIIMPLEAHDAYSGDILLNIGINSAGAITGLRVLEHLETPGLGDKIELRISSWILEFDNLSLNSPNESGWRIKKDGGEFDQFVGATITPRAVVNAVRKSLLFFELNKEQLLAR